MDFANRLVADFQHACRAMKQNHSAYYIEFDTSAAIFGQKCTSWNSSQWTGHDAVTMALLEAMRFAPTMLSWGHSAQAARNTVVSRTLAAAGFFVFAASSGKNITVFVSDEEQEKIAHVITLLKRLFSDSFATELRIERAPATFVDELETRIQEVHRFYIEKYGDWTQHFLNNLGDNISKISFRSFISQRMEAHMRWNAKAVYPIHPPTETTAWRADRKANPPRLPSIEHCSKEFKEILYLTTFIYEQYGIPGVVEAMPGQTVVDAGAYIGDTAMYFSSKVGSEGKVFAFEAIPASVAAANDNIRSNNCQNVEMVPFALSDKCETLRFDLNENSPSSSILNENGTTTVEAVSLDSFARSHSVHVDFLKSDIEGSEMELLRGAVKTIRRDTPVCAIALYHKQSDYFDIPNFLSTLHPKYKFYFRSEAEPVLFAVPF